MLAVALAQVGQCHEDGLPVGLAMIMVVVPRPPDLFQHLPLPAARCQPDHTLGDVNTGHCETSLNLTYFLAGHLEYSFSQSNVLTQSRQGQTDLFWRFLPTIAIQWLFYTQSIQFFMRNHGNYLCPSMKDMKSGRFRFLMKNCIDWAKNNTVCL